MKYKYFNAGYEANLNTPPNPITILSIISTLSTHSQIKGNVTKKLEMTQTCVETFIALNNIDHGNIKELLETYWKGMLEQGMKHLETGNHTVTLDFAYALKSATDIMSSIEGQYNEAWKKALGGKLTETQALLEQKMEKLKRKQANTTRKPSFWGQQPPSSSDENTSISQSDCAL